MNTFRLGEKSFEQPVNLGPSFFVFLDKCGLDVEGLTYNILFHFLNEKTDIKITFDDAVSTYSVRNVKTGRQMSAPYKESNTLPNRILQVILKFI